MWYALTGFRAVSEQARALVCWNAISLTYQVLAAPMILEKDTPVMHRRALLQDAGRLAIPLLVVLATAAL